MASRAELAEFVRLAVEALTRYRLRTALSVLGVVLGVAAVIAMMSVSEGAARQALAEVEALGVDNLVARSAGGVDERGVARRSLTFADAERIAVLVPAAATVSPVVARYLRVGRDGSFESTSVLGVRASYAEVLRLTVERGRFLTAADEHAGARVCVLGAGAARALLGYDNPLEQHVRIGDDHYRVVGTLRPQGSGPRTSGSLAWRSVNESVFVPLPALTGRTLALAPHQPVDEIWLRLDDGARAGESAGLLERALRRTHASEDVQVVVPRDLLAQRYRTQRTFSVVVGSIAALALVVGGIGIMNIMLTSVIERTREIGVRRTAGATRRAIAMQFLVEALLMTVGGGLAGILVGAAGAAAISAYAGWQTHVSIVAVLLGFAVSCLVGVAFGLYPAVKAAALEPVDAMRYE